MTIMCAWCGKIIKQGITPTSGLSDNNISHGCCKECAKIMIDVHLRQEYEKERVNNWKRYSNDPK